MNGDFIELIILTPRGEDYFTQEQKVRLDKAGSVVYVKGPKKFEEVKELSSSADKIVAIDPDFCDWKVPNEIIDGWEGLKAICLQTTSFSWVDTSHCKKKGVTVTNLRGFSSEAVAEWAVMIALALARKIPLLVKDGWKGDYDKHRGVELRGRVAGIVGLGTNGKSIAEICDGLGMKVIYWSKSTRDNRFKYVELVELMKTADFIFPAFAHTPETEKLLSDSILKSMKKTAVFVSTIHKIYNHELLLKSVDQGTLFGYGFELMPSEFKEFGNYKGNVWAGPDLAWATEDSIRKNAELWTDAICNAAEGAYPTKVN